MHVKNESLAVKHGLFPEKQITLVAVVNGTLQNTEPIERITGILRENVALRGRIVFKHLKEPIGNVRLIFEEDHLYISTDKEKTYRVEN